MKEVEITYRITKKEFVSHRMKFILRKMIFLYIISFIVLLAPVFIFLTSPIGTDLFEDNFIFKVLILPFITVLITYFSWYSFKKVYHNTKGLDQETYLKLSENEYYAKNSIAESTVQWSAIFKIKKEKKMLDIYFNKVAFASIPLRFIDDNQLIMLKEILNKAQVNNNL